MNENNLKSLAERTEEERTEIARKGALASAKAKQEKKILREEIVKRLEGEDINEIILNLIERAKHNSRDFETLRDTLGQKPTTISLNTEEKRVLIGLEDDVQIYQWEEV